MLRCEAITDINVIAADMLEQFDTELNAHLVTSRSSSFEGAYTTSSTGTACAKHSTAITSHDSIDEALTAEAAGDGADKI